ncbi:hypothetical protein D3C87_1677550 [compost metagenome]
MSSFGEEFRRYQKQENLLTFTIIVVSFLAPVSFTWLMNHKVHWAILGLMALAVVLSGIWIQFYRQRISHKLLLKYESLDVGSILTKKLNRKIPREFVIINRGYNHYYLKCVKTGEQMLVSKSRVREDFDIAN